MDTKKKIAALREEMKKEKIGVYIIPTSGPCVKFGTITQTQDETIFPSSSATIM